MIEACIVNEAVITIRANATNGQSLTPTFINTSLELAIIVFLLVFDLKRPDRFFYILTKPNLKSWLVWGGYILMAYGLLASLWLLYGFANGFVPPVLSWFTAILAICSACYSAFLFAQAKGRDLWQSPLFFWHLLAQAITAGSAVLLIVGAMVQTGPSLITVLVKILSISLIFALVMILGEISLAHVSEHVKRSTDLLKKGSLSGSFWGLAIGAGIMLPLILLFWSAFQDGLAYVPMVLASLFSLAGLWVFEDLWIKAGQAVPLS